MGRVIPLLALLAAAAALTYWISQRGDSHQSIQTTQGVSSLNASLPWQEYRSPHGDFRVLLPGLPRHAKEAVKEPKSHQLRDYEIYLAPTQKGTLYSINLISFPENKSDVYDEQFLEKTVNDMLTSNPANRIVKFDKSKWHSVPALDFAVDSEQTRVNGKAFIDGKTLYVLSTTAVSKDDLNQEEFDLFVKSFELEPKRP